VVFEYFYDVYLFEIKHVCKLNWPKRPSELLSVSVRRLLKVTNIRCFMQIKCSEQEARFKKIGYNVVISEKNSNVCW
jgi:hypothetical protein